MNKACGYIASVAALALASFIIAAAVGVVLVAYVFDFVDKIARKVKSTL